MAHGTLTPVFVGLRTGLRVLTVALLVLVAVQAAAEEGRASGAALTACVVFGVVFVLGVGLPRLAAQRRTVAVAGWLATLTLAWIALLGLVPEAAYLAFPLFFLYLHLLPRRFGPVAVLLAAVVAIVGLGLHDGFTVAGVVGPLVGAGVAVLLGLGYRALAQEAVEREALLRELVATRDRLAATEREQGVLAERSRLAREIHDTVAQALSSIQMLVHAAERADADRPGGAHLRLARETAAAALADTRRFIRELTPPALEQGLGAALRRLADDQRRQAGLAVDVRVPDVVDLPMHVQTALLRVAQGAVANVVQHARAEHVGIELDIDADGVRLSVADDGIGFDPEAVRTGARWSDSFGLRAIAERVEQLGGELAVDASPGGGTTLTVTVCRREP